MRAYEIITENKTGSLQDDVASAIPGAYAIPALQNQDPYKQYRFGMALAGARSAEQRDKEGADKFTAESPWGENAIVISYTGTTPEIIDDALESIGLGSGDKKLITPMGSKETQDIKHQSPVAQKKKNKYGV